MKFGDKWDALVKAGKFGEMQALLEAEKVRAKYEPDTVQQDKGKSARFTKKGKLVELGGDGTWHLVK